MLKEKAGETAGKIWSALNETEGLTAKQIKKATKLVFRLRARREQPVPESRRRTVC